MNIAITQEDFDLIKRQLPMTVQRFVFGKEISQNLFKELNENFEMENVLSLHDSLFSSKSFKGKSYTSFSELCLTIPNLAEEPVEDKVFITQFVIEIRNLEEFLNEMVTNFKLYKDSLEDNLKAMIDANKNMVLDRIILSQNMMPFSSRDQFEFRYSFVSGIKDKNTIYIEMRDRLSNYLIAKVRRAEKCTPKDFNRYYNTKTINTHDLFNRFIG
ncbi:MAG: hypothetical protein KF802_02565 [Bdellovibrionaceae bacterium]|nr:hypothetical protein [Pseudobdellovibrionaceae bacterium]